MLVFRLNFFYFFYYIKIIKICWSLDSTRVGSKNATFFQSFSLILLPADVILLLVYKTKSKKHIYFNSFTNIYIKINLNFSHLFIGCCKTATIVALHYTDRALALYAHNFLYAERFGQVALPQPYSFRPILEFLSTILEFLSPLFQSILLFPHILHSKRIALISTDHPL